MLIGGSLPPNVVGMEPFAAVETFARGTRFGGASLSLRSGSMRAPEEVKRCGGFSIWSCTGLTVSPVPRSFPSLGVSRRFLPARLMPTATSLNQLSLTATARKSTLGERRLSF